MLTIVPGLIALVEFPKLGADSGDFQYDNAIPLLMEKYLPNGVRARHGLTGAVFLVWSWRRPLTLPD